MYTISNSNGMQGLEWEAEYETEGEALDALCTALGWVTEDVATSEYYTVDEGEAFSVYDTQEECDADQDGTHAPRVVHHC